MKIHEDSKCKFPNIPYILDLEFNNGKPGITWFGTTFKNDKGEISLVHLGFHEVYGTRNWEICCTEGELFDDVERFETLLEATDRIKELLGGK